jgi:F-type H+-transporting ATPase subunit delta
VLGSLLISTEEKIALVDRVFGKQAAPRLLVFLKVLAHHGRLNLIRAARAEFDKQYNALRGRVAVELRTAAPAEEALRREVTERMRKLLAAEPLITTVVDPSLVGGLVVTVGDTVYDGSLATRLKQFRSQIIEKNVQEIETNRQRFLQSA